MTGKERRTAGMERKGDLETGKRTKGEMGGGERKSVGRVVQVKGKAGRKGGRRRYK